jgi:hypothetical protein
MVRHFCILSTYSSLDDIIDNDNSDEQCLVHLSSLLI